MNQANSSRSASTPPTRLRATQNVGRRSSTMVDGEDGEQLRLAVRITVENLDRVLMV
jgi:hypothetical protein